MAKEPSNPPPRPAVRKVEIQSGSWGAADSMTSANLTTALRIKQVSAEVERIMQSETQAAKTPDRAARTSVPVTKTKE